MSAPRQGGRRQTAAYISAQELAAREGCNIEFGKPAQTDSIVLPMGFKKKRANNETAIPTEAIPKESLPTEAILTEAILTEAFPTEAFPTEAVPPIPTSNTILQYSPAVFPVHQGLPWERYRPIVTSLDLGGKITIARGLKASTIVGLKQVSTSKPKQIVDHFHKLRSANLVNGLEAFNTSSQLFIVLEEMHVSLTSIVKSPVDLSSQQVAAVMGQVSLPS